jgi:hypothetical protein
MDDKYKELEETLADLVSGLFEEKMAEPEEAVIYESIDDYETKTGKRFRMLKSEKEAGLSREDAFRQRFPS